MAKNNGQKPRGGGKGKESFVEKQIKKISNLIMKAKNKYIVGFKSTAGIANFFGVRLGFMLENVSTFNIDDSVVVNSIFNINELPDNVKNTLNSLIAVAEKIGIKATNVASILMALKKDGVKVVRIDGKMVLAKNVNIGFVGKANENEVKD